MKDRIALIIVGTWAFCIIFLLVLWAVPGGITSTDVKETLKIFGGTTSGLVGVIIGYYFTK